MGGTVFNARAQLRKLMTRQAKAPAAPVSNTKADRIWKRQKNNPKQPLGGLRRLSSRGQNAPGIKPGPDGTCVTAREVALKVREAQMPRAEERRILARGGLDPVAGGDLAARPVSSLWRRWFRI